MGNTHRLTKPIKRRDFTIEEITIGEVTGETMLLIDDYAEKPVRLSMMLIAQLAEVDGKRGEITFKDVCAMAAEDIADLGELVAATLPDGQPTGPTL